MTFDDFFSILFRTKSKTAKRCLTKTVIVIEVTSDLNL